MLFKYFKKINFRFKHAYMRYRDGLPSVLKDVSINIKPREKIGVVGRTGSGNIYAFRSLDY